MDAAATLTALTGLALTGDVAVLGPLADLLEETGREDLAATVRRRTRRFRAMLAPHNVSPQLAGLDYPGAAGHPEEQRRWYAARVLWPLPGVKPRLPDVLPRFADYHLLHPAWGSLHVVLGDGNTDDAAVLFCRRFAADRGDTEGYALALTLTFLSPSQRGRIDRKVSAWHDRRIAGRFRRRHDELAP